MPCWLLADVSIYYGLNYSYLNSKPLKMLETKNYHKRLCILFILCFPRLPCPSSGILTIIFSISQPHKKNVSPCFPQGFSHIQTGSKPCFFFVHCISWHHTKCLGLVMKSHFHFKAPYNLTCDIELTSHGEMCWALTVLTGIHFNSGE